MVKSDEELFKEACMFNCMGEVNLKDNKLGNNFLKNNFMNCFLIKSIDFLPDTVLFFGRKYNVDAAFLNQNKIFNGFRKNYLALYHYASKTDSRMFGPLKLDSRSKNYSQLRRDICEFMNFISFYFAKSSDDDFISWCRQVLPSFLHNLSSLWNLQKNISVNFIPANNSMLYQGCSASHHLLHLELDLKCYRLIILYRVEHLLSLCDIQDVSRNSNEDIKIYILDFLQYLFCQSLSRFEKVSDHELKRKSPFVCTCVKELWLLLQIFMDTYQNKHQQSGFWSAVNDLCMQLFNNEIQKSAVGALSCSNPVLFSLWMLFHVGQLYLYSNQGDYIGPSSERMLPNYPLLEKSLKLLLFGEVTEAQLRACIPFITDLVLNVWPSQREPVCKLWEHFHHRLNSYFFLHGSAPDSIAILSTSGSEMLMQVSSIMNPSKKASGSVCLENSFHLFLNFLGTFLKRNSSQWFSIKGRIYSKFSESKMQMLKVMGIYNFSTLFLSMAMSGQTKEIGYKMQELLHHVLSPSLDFNRRLVVWKANLALLQMFVEKEMDIAEVSKIFMDDVSRVSNFKNKDTTALLNVFAKGLKDIVDISKSLNLSEYTLIGNWINSYFKLSSDCGELINTLVEIMKRILTISRSVGMIEYNAPESHLTKMYLAICKYLLPYIKEKFATFDRNCCNDKVADLAVNITLLALNRSNVGVSGTSVPHLFECFCVNANPLNANLSVRYICTLLQEEGILSELMDTYTNYDVLIIQTWLRCSAYLSEKDGDELLNLTRIVCRIPSFHSLCQNVSMDFNWESEPIETFILLIKQLYEQKKTLEERSEFRQECILFLTPLVKSFDRMLRYKDVSETVYLRIYNVAAFLVQNCGLIIYSKLQPQCIFNYLVNTLLLPASFFKPGFEIPKKILSVIQRTFSQFIHGIILLNNVSGNSLLPVIKSLIIKFFPRLVGKSVMYPQESSHTVVLPGHPLISCFAEDDEVSKLVLEIITQSFIKIGDVQCMNALMFLLEVLREKKFSKDMVHLILNSSLSNIFEVIILCDPSMAVVKRHAINLLKEMLNNQINNCPELSDKFWTLLISIVPRHIVVNTVNVMSLLCKICDLAPNMVMKGLSDLKDVQSSPQVFHRTNVSKIVRAGVENIEKLLQLSK